VVEKKGGKALTEPTSPADKKDILPAKGQWLRAPRAKKLENIIPSHRCLPRITPERRLHIHWWGFGGIFF